MENAGACVSPLRDGGCSRNSSRGTSGGHLCWAAEGVGLTHTQTACVTQTLQYGHVFLPLENS